MNSIFSPVRTFLAVLILLLFTNKAVKAQFSYGGVRLSYHNVRFDKGGDFEGTRLNDFVANLDLLHRPIRNFAFGASVRIPIVNGFKYQYILDEGNFETITGGGILNEDQVQYAEGDFYYNIKNTVSLTFLGRVYFDTESNIYLDLRYTIASYDETFTFERSSGNLPNRDINYQNSVSTTGIGFGVGYNMRISDHFYFGYALAVDFLGTDEVSFEYDIESDGFSSQNPTTIKSKIDDSQTAYELSASIGYIL